MTEKKEHPDSYRWLVRATEEAARALISFTERP